MRLFVHSHTRFDNIAESKNPHTSSPAYFLQQRVFDIIAYLLQIVQTAFKPLQMPSEIIGIRLCKGHFMSLHSDILVVGAGPAGLSFAAELVYSGLKVTLIERSPLTALRNPLYMTDAKSP